MDYSIYRTYEELKFDKSDYAQYSSVGIYRTYEELKLE